jgi:hypothetical protein
VWSALRCGRFTPGRVHESDWFGTWAPTDVVQTEKLLSFRVTDVRAIPTHFVCFQSCRIVTVNSFKICCVTNLRTSCSVLVRSFTLKHKVT